MPSPFSLLALNATALRRLRPCSVIKVIVYYNRPLEICINKKIKYEDRTNIYWLSGAGSLLY